MKTTTDQILKGVLAKYPQKSKQNIANCSDKNIEAKLDFFHQYIFGVIPYESFGQHTINNYSYHMQKRLEHFPVEIHTSPWPFQEDQIDDLRAVLQELSDYFDAKLDVTEMVDRAIKVKTNLYYIIITIVRSPVIYIA